MLFLLAALAAASAPLTSRQSPLMEGMESLPRLRIPCSAGMGAWI